VDQVDQGVSSMTLSSTAVPAGTALNTPLGPPIAHRLRRPSWRDPRLVIGLLLLFTSVALGARVVALADHTEPVYAARATLPTGTALSAEALQVVRLRLTGTSAGYLAARRPIPAGQVLIRAVGAGEIVPLSALAPADTLQSRPVAIPVAGAPPAGLAAGGRVDVWSSAKRRDAVGGGYDQPERIARMVEVFEVDRPDTGLSGSRSGSVEVLLPDDSLPLVLDALANQAQVVVLPVPGSVKRSEEGQ
jgi:hypothetical protein